MLRKEKNYNLGAITQQFRVTVSESLLGDIERICDFFFLQLENRAKEQTWDLNVRATEFQQRRIFSPGTSPSSKSRSHGI